MNGAQVTGQLLPLEKVIKPNQVQNLGCLTPEQKTKYTNGVTALWKRITDNPAEDSPDRRAAHKNLSDVSYNLKAMMTKWKAQQGQQGQQGQLQGQLQAQQQAMQQQQAQQQQAQQQQQLAQAQQQAQAMNQAMAQNAQAGQAARPQGPQVYSDRVREQARALNVRIPPQIRNRTQEEIVRWVNEEKRKYASLLAVYEARSNEYTQFTTNFRNHQNQGRKFSDAELANIKARGAQMQELMSQARSNCLMFKKSREEGADPSQQQQAQQQQAQAQQQQQQQQAQQHAQQQQAQQQAQRQAQASQEQQQAAKLQQQQNGTATQQSQLSPIKQEDQKPGVDQNAKMEVDVKTEAGRKPSVTVATPANSEAQGSGSATSHAQPTMQTAVPPVGAFTGAPTQSSPQSAPNSASAAPKPLTREAAVEMSARSHSTNPQNANQSGASTPTPSVQREPSAQSNSNLKPGRQIQVTSPSPVGMPAARPSLSGGPTTVGQMGQAAIQKPPTFTLEGEGERVLSKKKLEDLVRQVTGVAGGEGELLDPDVEETLLDVADEFVDNVIASACRLAKIRGSASLEVRDIQIILERNYNIRVPGFASDELRTVRKIQPTQGWTQKMSAVQAAKVTGGKGDL